MGRHMAERITNCQARFYPDEAHLSLLIGHAGEFLATLGSEDHQKHDGWRKSNTLGNSGFSEIKRGVLQFGDTTFYLKVRGDLLIGCI